jgi:hypothetical protein
VKQAKPESAEAKLTRISAAWMKVMEDYDVVAVHHKASGTIVRFKKKKKADL